MAGTNTGTKLTNSNINVNKLKFDLANKSIKYPLLLSPKLDGHKLIIKNGEILTKGGKHPKNKKVEELLEEICHISRKEEFVFEGEFYKMGSKGLHEITSDIQKDGKDVSMYKLYIFDGVRMDEYAYTYAYKHKIPRFIDRYKRLEGILQKTNVNLNSCYVLLPQILVKNWKEAYEYMCEYIYVHNYEGIILRSEHDMYLSNKYKYWKNRKAGHLKMYKFRKEMYINK